MNIKSTVEKDKCLQVKLTGNLDLAGVEAVEMDFVKLQAEGKNLLIDLTEVDFIASMGIRMLLTGAKQLSRRDLKLVLAVPNECVKEALEITNISSIISCFDTIEEAEKSF
jgi:anti-anti-sigma factor